MKQIDPHHDLMLRIAADDEHALSELVEAVGPALLAFVERSLGSRGHEAEDIAQEAFIRLWRARHRWRPAATVRTYLFTIATRLALNRQRGWKRRPPEVSLALDDGQELEPADGAPDPERLAASSQLRRLLAGELASLPTAQRFALLLKTVGGLRYEEIAEALGVSAAAVESLLSRARARLRPRLAAFRTEGKPSSWG
ncbi:MAG TPA: RNA polymerase sigma factor [Thermoanaerobaculaceae bacterium]|nr:RNA polymerase sigma factor [Thermoanaerobaculaceae bacterium]HRS15677.1 RNA polymerase sigma factor [Thermoanaerobaculaceae bacterium]